MCETKKKILITTAMLGSLFLNVFLLGMVTSGAFDQHHPGPPPFDMSRGPMTESIRNLSPEAQERVNEPVQQTQELFSRRANSMIEGFDKISDILTSPQFNEEALRETFNRMDNEDAAFKKEFGDLIIKIATTLSDEERVAFFSTMPFRPPFPMMGKRGRGREDHIPPMPPLMDRDEESKPPRPDHGDGHDHSAPPPPPPSLEFGMSPPDNPSPFGSAPQTPQTQGSATTQSAPRSAPERSLEEGDRSFTPAPTIAD